MIVSKEIEIDMGHRVPNHKSKCRNPHGHRYKIQVTVNDNIIMESGASDEGMVIDFSDLKELMITHIDNIYDHSFTISKDDKYLPFFLQMKDEGMKINIVDFIPTAENLAQHWYSIMKQALSERKIRIVGVQVHETPTSVAVYYDE